MTLHIKYFLDPAEGLADYTDLSHKLWTDPLVPPRVLFSNPLSRYAWEKRYLQKYNALLGVKTEYLEGFLWKQFTSINPECNYKKINHRDWADMLSLVLIDWHTQSDPCMQYIQPYLGQPNQPSFYFNIQSFSQLLSELFLDYENHRYFQEIRGQWHDHWPKNSFFHRDPVPTPPLEFWQMKIYGASLALFKKRTTENSTYLTLPQLAHKLINHFPRTDHSGQGPALYIGDTILSEFHRHALLHISNQTDLYLFLWVPQAHYWTHDIQMENNWAQPTSEQIETQNFAHAPRLLYKWGAGWLAGQDSWNQLTQYQFAEDLSVTQPRSAEPINSVNQPSQVLESSIHLQKNLEAACDLQELRQAVQFSEEQSSTPLFPTHQTSHPPKIPNYSLTLHKFDDLRSEFKFICTHIYSLLNKNDQNNPEKFAVWIIQGEEGHSLWNWTYNNSALAGLPYTWTGKRNAEQPLQKALKALIKIISSPTLPQNWIDFLLSPLLLEKTGITANFMKDWLRQAQLAGLGRFLDELEKEENGWGQDDTYTFCAYIQNMLWPHPENGPLLDSESWSPILEILHTLWWQKNSLRKNEANSEAWYNSLCTLLRYWFVTHDTSEDTLFQKFESHLQEQAQLPHSFILPLEMRINRVLLLIDEISDLKQENHPPQGILVGPPGSSGFWEIDHLYICGLQSGLFPGTASQSPLDLRADFWQKGDLTQESRDRITFLQGLLTPKLSLTLSYSSHSYPEGKELFPSSLLMELKRFGLLMEIPRPTLSSDILTKAKPDLNNSQYQSIKKHPTLSTEYTSNHTLGTTTLILDLDYWVTYCMDPLTTVLKHYHNIASSWQTPEDEKESEYINLPQSTYRKLFQTQIEKSLYQYFGVTDYELPEACKLSYLDRTTQILYTEFLHNLDKYFFGFIKDNLTEHTLKTGFSWAGYTLPLANKDVKIQGTLEFILESKLGNHRPLILATPGTKNKSLKIQCKILLSYCIAQLVQFDPWYKKDLEYYLITVEESNSKNSSFKCTLQKLVLHHELFTQDFCADFLNELHSYINQDITLESPVSWKNLTQYIEEVIRPLKSFNDPHAKSLQEELFGPLRQKLKHTSPEYGRNEKTPFFLSSKKKKEEIWAELLLYPDTAHPPNISPADQLNLSLESPTPGGTDEKEEATSEIEYEKVNTLNDMYMSDLMKILPLAPPPNKNILFALKTLWPFLHYIK